MVAVCSGIECNSLFVSFVYDTTLTCKWKLIFKWKDEQLDSLWKRGQSPIGIGRSQKMHTDESTERFDRSAICSRMFPNRSFFVVLRFCRLILLHCSFSSSIAKQIHLPIQFLFVINLGCFHTQVLCNMSFSPLHCLLSLRSLESFHRVRSVSKLNVHSNKELKSRK